MSATLTARDLTIEKNHEGAHVISAFVTDGPDAFLHCQRFYGYSRRESVAMYLADAKRRGFGAYRD